MFDILFSLAVIFVLLPLLFIIIISKASFKLNDKTIVFITISVFSIIVGMLMAPLTLNQTGELYGHYILKIIYYKIPLITHTEAAMPLTHAIGVLFYDLTKIDLYIFFNLFRMFLYFFYLYGIYLIFSLFKETINDKFKYSFLLLFFLILLDYNGTHLFTGDQFRNFLGQVFFIYFVYYYFLNKKLISFTTIFFITAAMASHKLYVIFIPFFVILYYIFKCIKLNNNFNLTLIVPLFSLLLVSILQEISIYINFMSLANKLNSHNIPTGMALINSPGVLVQLIFHLMLVYFIIKVKKNIILNQELMFIIFITIMMLVIARINFFGVQFVGPSRIYGIMAPFIFIILTITINNYVKIYNTSILPKVFLVGYFILSFCLINFSKQSFSPHILLIKQNIFNLDKYFGNNLELIYYLAIFFILLVFIDFIVNKYLKMKKDILLLVWNSFTICSLILLITLFINHSFDIYFYILFILLVIFFIMGKVFLSILPRKKRNQLNEG